MDVPSTMGRLLATSYIYTTPIFYSRQVLYVSATGGLAGACCKAPLPEESCKAGAESRKAEPATRGAVALNLPSRLTQIKLGPLTEAI